MGFLRIFLKVCVKEISVIFEKTTKQKMTKNEKKIRRKPILMRSGGSDLRI